MRSNRLARRWSASLGLALLAVLVACSGLANPGLPTPLPADFVPTAAALTLQASQPLAAMTASPAVETPGQAEMTPSPVPNEQNPNATSQQPGEAEITPAPALTDPNPSQASPPGEAIAAPTLEPTQPILLILPPTATATPAPGVPEGRIQFYRLGELSKVTSPVKFTAYLGPGAVGPVQIELAGEDGRLLFRELKHFEPRSDLWANLPVKIEFEIPSVAELGRLTISSVDVFGRLQAVNSVDLVLMSTGEPEWNPATTLAEPIVIDQPVNKALVQGGRLVVSGLARITPGELLRVELVSENGRVVGQRVARVETAEDGGWGHFIVEVPYTVTALTPVRLLVYESGEPVSAIRRLTSLEVSLSP